jgi:tetratricopeptide (TPR) repeat protein
VLTDNEIKRVAEDALGFKAWARMLEEIICSSKTPITIGVYGEWGTGKTSLMRMTEDLLKEKNEVKTVWFDAWKFDKTHDLRVALIDTVLRTMERDKSIDKSLKQQIGELLRRVNWLGLGKMVLSSFLPLFQSVSQAKEPFLGSPEDVSGKTLELIGDFEDEFRNLAGEYTSKNGRLVVFVDDLDRCIPEKAVDVLEAIKLFLNVEGSVFIIGADKKAIEEGVLQKYGMQSENWGRDYLDKIIQIPIILPPLRKEIITEQFILGLEISDEIRKYVDIIAEVGDNPRTIKRLLNRFEIQTILAKKRELKVEGGVLAKLVVIEFRWPDFYTDLITVFSETQTNLAQVLMEISKGTDIEREKRLEGWETIRKYSENKRLMRFISEEEPLLHDVELDHYVFMGRSTTELKESAENYLSIAYSFTEKGEYAKAIENCEKATELNPGYEKAWNGRGVALTRIGNYEEAIACFKKAIEINPESEDAWVNRGIALNRIGNYEEAIACFKKAIEINPESEDAWVNRGIALNRIGNYEEAATCFDKAIEMNPKNDQAWFEKSLALTQSGRKQEAKICYEKAVEVNPKGERAWIDKGLSFAELGRHEEAMECFGEVLKINPENKEALINKGAVLNKLGRHEEAVECFEEARKIDPENKIALVNTGNALERMGKHEEAIRIYDAVILVDPKNEEAWINKGVALSKLGRHEEALKSFGEVRRIAPDNETALINTGIALDRMRKHEEAIRSFNTAIKTNPENENAWINKGVALSKLWRLEEAIECFEEAIRINPENEEAWCRKGDRLAEMERIEEALNCYDKSIRLNPSYAGAWHGKGKIFERLGQREKASKVLRKAKRLKRKEGYSDFL